MKAISLWQPWASAMEIGAKTIETRGWATKYRGPLAIHAAKRCKKQETLWMLASDWVWKGIFKVSGEDVPTSGDILGALPFGRIIAVANLIDCVGTDSLLDADVLTANGHREAALGDYSPGRYAWMTDNLRQLRKPIPWKGSQGFFNVPDDIINQVGFVEKGKERL